MIYQQYAQNTRDWINIRCADTISEPMLDWLRNHDGGMYHIHNSERCVKFECEQDAVLFALRWV